MLDRIQLTHEVEEMCCVKRGVKGEPAPIPQEGEWIRFDSRLRMLRTPAGNLQINS